MTLDDLGRFSDPAILILISLSGGDKHGYLMMQDIEQIATVKLGPGTLYGALSRLEDRALIEVVPTDDRRKPYRLTEAGKTVLRDYLNSLTQLTTEALARLSS